MVVLGGIDCFEIPRFRGAGYFPLVWGVVLRCCSGTLMVFATEDGKVGGPPGFGVVGRPRYWPVFFQDSHEAIKRLGQTFVQF